jgi:hypothetical protein
VGPARLTRYPAPRNLSSERGSSTLRAARDQAAAAARVSESDGGAPLTDRLSLTNALADANIDRQKAERIATEIFDAIHDNVATKQDLELVRADIRALELRLQTRFEETERRIDRVVVRLGSLIVVLTGLLFAALHYWPPHG